MLLAGRFLRLAEVLGDAQRILPPYVVVGLGNCFCLRVQQRRGKYIGESLDGFIQYNTNGTAGQALSSVRAKNVLIRE
jgi:hypothetical protein